MKAMIHERLGLVKNWTVLTSTAMDANPGNTLLHPLLDELLASLLMGHHLRISLLMSILISLLISLRIISLLIVRLNNFLDSRLLGHR